VAVFDLSFLNNEQREAVQNTEGAVLVLAGAGTGKTRVLTARMAYVVSEGLAKINEILAVTFTNKAAREMQERTVTMLERSCVKTHGRDTSWIGTFHALALKMIRPLYDKFRRTSSFSIVDADDQIRIIKKVMQELGITDKKYTPKQMASHINKWKDKCHGPEEAKRIAQKYGAEGVAIKIYEPYQNSLEELDAIDFGDILKISIEIFKYDTEILSWYQNKFKYIMVDEYQDTNVAQYVWLRLLSMAHGNICCVGDDDQSIYGWRGADVGNILKFEHDFKNATIIRLGQNYRSTKNIVKAASSLISNNSVRIKKEFWTEDEVGSPVNIKALSDPITEARFITSLIERKQKAGLNFGDMAILVRVAAQTRAFEERFLTVGIPYIVVGGVRFYERKEVKDAIAYLKLITKPDDAISFERIINIPKRGVCPAMLNRFFEIARNENISLLAAAKIVVDETKTVSAYKVVSFLENIECWSKDIEILAPSDLMRKILLESGYIQMLEGTKTVEDETRLETLNELVNALREFENVHEFLDYISLVLDLSATTTMDRVTISTIHAAKGLEYHTVFIPGFEETIIPHQRSIAENGAIGVEEERRLCYVALTRAKKEAYITFCSKINMYSNYGAPQRVNPSRFLYDLPKDGIRIL
jgi:DNA helicase-2/ATP-dependent DNA helicase PcrA